MLLCPSFSLFGFRVSLHRLLFDLTNTAKRQKFKKIIGIKAPSETLASKNEGITIFRNIFYNAANQVFDSLSDIFNFFLSLYILPSTDFIEELV